MTNKYLLFNLIQNQRTNHSSLELDRSSNRIFTFQSFLSSEKWFIDKHSGGWTPFYTFLSLIFPSLSREFQFPFFLLPSGLPAPLKKSLSLEPQALLAPPFFFPPRDSAMPCIISKINSLDGPSPFLVSSLSHANSWEAVTVARSWRKRRDLLSLLLRYISLFYFSSYATLTYSRPLTFMFQRLS